MQVTFTTIKQRIVRALEVFYYYWPSAWGGFFLREWVYRKRMKNLGGGVHFGDRITIDGFSNISVGNETSFMSGSYLYANDNGKLTVGSRCSFNHNVNLGASSGEIIIGDDVLMGPNVVLRAANHVFNNPLLPIRRQGHMNGKIIVENDVWLAANVVVTSGVSIGRGCVVGAGSVVTQDLPSMTVCVGVPARPIKRR